MPRQPTVQEVFKYHVGERSLGKLMRDWHKYREQLKAILAELVQEGYQTLDLDDSVDVDKLMYTIKDAQPDALSNAQNWEDNVND